MARLTYAQAQALMPHNELMAMLVSGQNPDGSTFALPVEAPPYEFKTVSYDTSAAYDTALATETAAGWEPHLIAPGDRTVIPGRLVVTYRRAL